VQVRDTSASGGDAGRSRQQGEHTDVMRLAITHAYSWPDVRRGAERITVELARALGARGHRVVHLTSARRPGVRHDDRVTTIRLPRVHRNRPRHERAFSRVLVPLLRAGRYDAVHSLGVLDGEAGLRAGRRTLYENMGVPSRAWWDTQPERLSHERLVADADVYGCMSRYALGFLARDYGRVGELTPGGVNIAEFQPSGARQPQPTLLFSGAVDEPRKGLSTLLAALPAIARSEPRVRLWISGPGDPGPLLAAAPREARERVDVLGLGGVHDQASRYGGAWVTVLPSRDEVFGLVLLESLACGTPLVGTAHAAVPELVTPEVGSTFPPDDVDALARACLQSIALARQPGIVEVCRAAAAPYDWVTGLAPRLEALYER
jgi:phosphatidylinositol alpha-mannosyltransferase